MEKLLPSQLALPKPVSFVRTCPESLSRSFADSLAKSLASLTWISLSFLIDSLILHSMSLQRSNFESLTLDSWSLPIASLTLHSLSRIRNRFHSLTWHSLSLRRGNLQSLTLQSLSLSDENCFQPISFREVILEDGSLKENEKSLAHTKLKRRAGTNSFSNKSFEKRVLAKEAETNSFAQSLSKRNLSLRTCLRIFLLCSFQLVCAALLLGNSSFRMSFPTESLQTDQLVAAYRSSFKNSSLQPEELVAAYFRKSFEQQSHQQDELSIAYLQSPTRAIQLESLQQKKISSKSLDSFYQLDLDTSLSLPWFSFSRCSFQFQPEGFDNSSFEQMELSRRESFLNQLDLEISLSFPKLGSIRFSYQLQADSFDRISFEHRALQCAALLQSANSNRQLQDRSVQSFQLTGIQLRGLVQGGAYTALQIRASSPPLHCPASTLHSLSLALGAWLKPSSKIAWRSIALRKSLFSTSFPTTSSHTAASMRALQPTPFRTTSSFRTILFWFSFLFHNFFFSNSFGREKILKKDELSKTVLELELDELLADTSCSLGPYDHLEQEKALVSSASATQLRK